MSTPFKLTRVASLKTVADFRTHCANVGADLPLEDTIEAGAGNPSRSQSNARRSTARPSVTVSPSTRWKAGTAPRLAVSPKR